MGLKDLNTTPPEVLTYDHIFLEFLSMTQEKRVTDIDPPVYKVEIAYRRYAIDLQGKRHYEGVTRTMAFPDFYTLAAEKAVAGKLGPQNALTAIQSAFAVLLQDEEGLNIVEV